MTSRAGRLVVGVGLALVLAPPCPGQVLPGGALARLDVSSGPRPHEVHGVAVSPDGKLIAAVDSGYSLTVWNAATGAGRRRARLVRRGVCAGRADARGRQHRPHRGTVGCGRIRRPGKSFPDTRGPSTASPSAARFLPPAATTTAFACGTRPRPGNCVCWRDTRDSCRPWPSLPTAASSPRPASTAPCAVGRGHRQGAAPLRGPPRPGPRPRLLCRWQDSFFRRPRPHGPAVGGGQR